MMKKVLLRGDEMYQTITNHSTFELVEKKSRFIANLIYIENKEQAELEIKQWKKKFHDARHNCFAYRILEEESIYEKSSDDGEPTGTAGGPILNILQKNNISNVLVIVTRYFGGILLGTGGLVRCYSEATLGAIEKTHLISIERGCEYEIKVEYSDFQVVQYYLQKNNIKIIDIKYEEEITCWIEMKNSVKEKFLADVKNREINIKKVSERKKKYVRI